MDGDYRDGTDLILAIDVAGVQTALGHSGECKIAYKAETGTRKTKEAAAGKWDEKYVKSVGVTVTASGFVHDGDSAKAGLPTIKTIFKLHKTIKASWFYRADPTKIESGLFVVTQINQTGKAGDDETYDITLENSGAVNDETAAAAAITD